MKIGDRVRLKQDVDMGYILYKEGHEFTICGSDNIRGVDLIDDDGNELGECRFVKMEVINIANLIDKKLKKILKK